jgi:hypothetical protein
MERLDTDTGQYIYEVMERLELAIANMKKLHFWQKNFQAKNEKCFQSRNERQY